MFDPKQMASQVPLFVSIDKESDAFYQLLKDKNIEPKTLQDLPRIEKFFNATLKTIINMIKESKYENDEKELLAARIVLDMHGYLGEKYGFDAMAIAHSFGPWNVEVFTVSIENIKKYM